MSIYTYCKTEMHPDLGLTHNEIAEFLEISLESITGLDLEESA